MEEQEVIRRLKGLGGGGAPPAPDFASATLPTPTPVAARSRMRLGMAPLAAVVGVLALGTAALAVPQGGPLRQAVAGFTSDVEVETDLAEVNADLEGDDSGASGSVGANPCEGPPPAPTGTTVPGTEGAEGGVSVDIDPEDREAQLRAWQEWREANCGPAANDDDGDDDSDADERQKADRDKEDKAGDRGKSGDRRPEGHPHEDDPCKGPPPHSNKPGSGDPGRDEAQRKAEQEKWHRWHKENCPPGQTGEHPGKGSGEGKPEDAGRPEGRGEGRPDDAGQSEGKGEGRPEGAGKPEGRP